MARDGNGIATGQRTHRHITRHVVNRSRWAAALLTIMLLVGVGAMLANTGRKGSDQNLAQVATSTHGWVSFNLVDPQLGLLLVSSNTRTVLAITTDGGHTWRDQLVIPGMTKLPAAYFFHRRYGVLIGEQGSDLAEWLTSDGGSHWQRRAIRLDRSVAVVASDFVDRLDGWLLTTTYAVGPGSPVAAIVYQTIDGGYNWTKVGMINAGSATYWFGITFADANTGAITVSTTLPELSLYETTDSGRTWNPLRLVPPAHGVFTENSLTFFPRSRGGVLQVSVTAEAQRQCASPAASSPVTWQECQNESRTSQYAFVTGDRGLTWGAPKHLPTVGNLDAVDPQRWVMVSGAKFLVTINGGVTWSSVGTIPARSGWNANEAQFVDLQHGWVSEMAPTDEGPYATSPERESQLLSTSDGGITWSEVWIPTV